MRARAAYKMSPALIWELHAQLAAMPGISGVVANPRVGSLLFYYADQTSRLSALRLLASVKPADLPADSGQERKLEDNPVLAGIFSLARFFFVRPFLPPAWRLATCFVAALPFLLKGARALLRGKLNVDVLDASAITASMLMRDFNTASTLMLLLGLGETLEAWTKQRSLQSLSESLSLNVDNVWILDSEGTEVNVPLAQVREGDLVVVRDGGSIPVDGIVEDGEGVVNQATMTGEPLGVVRSRGGAVYAGTVVEEGRLVIRVSKVGDQTRLLQIASFIEESEALKASIQGKSERMADLAVPFTFGLAALVWFLTRNPMQVASVLLVDYSCALKLATPLAVLAAMREGARRGVIIKGGRYLEALHEADTVVFDKTGTLTSASPQVVEVIAAEGHDREEVLRTMACLEEHFPHPVARAVVRKAKEEDLQHEEKHTQVEYVVAHGIASSIDGRKLRVGSRHYVENDEGVDISPLASQIAEQAEQGRSLLYLAEDGKLAGIVAIEDPLRAEARAVVAALRERGFKRILMLTGDEERTARAVAARAGIDEFRAQVLPTGKADVIRELNASGCKVMMIGDGINDAPALSAAHVGVAMVDGTDLAQEVANVLLTRPDLSGLLEARQLADSTLRRIRINFAATISLNSLFLVGGLFGFLPPSLSAVLHNLTTLAVSLNAMRPHRPANISGLPVQPVEGE